MLPLESAQTMFMHGTVWSRNISTSSGPLRARAPSMARCAGHGSRSAVHESASGSPSAPSGLFMIGPWWVSQISSGSGCAAAHA